jgi:ATP-dependent helicase Lhr and Lhr-like helicase
VPAVPGNRVVFRDGVAVGAMVAGKTRFLADLDAAGKESVRWFLVRRSFDPARIQPPVSPAIAH